MIMLSNCSLSGGCVVSHCSSICTSLVSNDVEHLIMCSVAIHIASFMKGLFFFIGYSSFYYWFVGILYVFWICLFFNSLPFNFLSDILINWLIRCNLLSFFSFMVVLFVSWEITAACKVMKCFFMFSYRSVTVLALI